MYIAFWIVCRIFLGNFSLLRCWITALDNNQNSTTCAAVTSVPHISFRLAAINIRLSRTNTDTSNETRTSRALSIVYYGSTFDLKLTWIWTTMCFQWLYSSPHVRACVYHILYLSLWFMSSFFLWTGAVRQCRGSRQSWRFCCAFFFMIKTRRRVAGLALTHLITNHFL